MGPVTLRVGRRPRPRTLIASAVLAAVAVGLVVGWQVARSPATASAANCGSVTVTMNATKPVIADAGSLSCFHTAAKACEPASIVLHELGVGIRSDYVFTIRPGRAPCQVTESTTRAGKAAATSCGMSPTISTGVYVSCGTQFFVIPDRTSVRNWEVPYHQASVLPRATCGWIPAGAVRTGSGAAVTCFRSAARACKPAGIGMHEQGADTTASDVFSVLAAGTPCQVEEVSQTYFASGNYYGPVSTQACRVTAIAVSEVTLSCGGQPVQIGSG